MSEGASQRIVAFIAGLFPLYTHDRIGNRHGARSLLDGTLILPSDEPEADEDGWIEVYWQGDPGRTTETHGTYLATLALTRYVELHAFPAAPRFKDEYAHMAQHFTFKTGESLVLDVPDPENRLAEMLKEASQFLGKEVVKQIVKKALGL